MCEHLHRVHHSKFCLCPNSRGIKILSAGTAAVFFLRRGTLTKVWSQVQCFFATPYANWGGHWGVESKPFPSWPNTPPLELFSLICLFFDNSFSCCFLPPNSPARSRQRLLLARCWARALWGGVAHGGRGRKGCPRLDPHDHPGRHWLVLCVNV